MDPLLKKIGKIVSLRHAISRWLEYSFGMGLVAVLALGLGKWQGWPLLPIVTLFVILALACMGVAGHFAIQLLALETHTRRIERSRAARRSKTHS